MPQAMSINHTTPRRKVQQLQAHRQHDPRHNQARPSSPRALQSSIPHNTKRTPQNIRNKPNRDIGSHVVRVVPCPKRQITHMRDIKRNAKHRPSSQNTLPARITIPLIKPKDAYWRKVKTVEHACTSSEVVQFFREPKVPRMENHAKHPTRQAKVAEEQVIWP